MEQIINSVLHDWFGDSMYGFNQYEAKLSKMLILKVLKRYSPEAKEEIEKEYPNLDHKLFLLDYKYPVTRV